MERRLDSMWSFVMGRPRYADANSEGVRSKNFVTPCTADPPSFAWRAFAAATLAAKTPRR
jgi:hypothetical protein